MTTTPPIEKNTSARKPYMAWVLRVVKGALVGIGAILPGLSGGVLMVIFGIYDPLLDFLGHFPRNFRRYMRLFLPIGIGGVAGILLFSGAVTVAFGTYAAQFISLFIGFVVGTIPGLWKTAGLKGRGAREWIALILASSVILILMLAGNQEVASINPNFITWIGGGLLVGLGFIVPGLSPSNFLIYMGIYSKMTEGISTLDWTVILPLILGVLIAAVLFAKIVNGILLRFYGVMYHIILGTVIGSSLAIFPTVVAPGLSPAGLAEANLSLLVALSLIVFMFLIGLTASLLFSRLELLYDSRNNDY